MRDILIYSCFLLVGFRLIKSDQTVDNTLKCYQCHLPAQTNLDGTCNIEDLKTCPNDYAFDRCTTTFRKNSTTGFYNITKQCALAPCEFEEVKINKLLKISDCDMTKQDAICSKCCEGDGCNYASSAFSIKQRISGSPTLYHWAPSCFTTMLALVLTFDLNTFPLRRAK